MIRTLALTLILTCIPAFCQTAPAFDIADVHLSPHADWTKSVANWMEGGVLAGDRYQLRRATMVDLIRAAYNVDFRDEVYGGPNWLDYDRFEVIAKTKPGTRPATLRLMLQTLLADRFHLAVKLDTRPVPGYLLKTSKGNLKINAADDSSAPSGCENTPRLDAGAMYNNIRCRNVTMEQYAVMLRGLVGSHPVADATGLDGGWDFEEHYATASLAAGTSDAVATEILDKLGLKLEKGNVPEPVMTVVSVDELPSPNPPGLAAALPPLSAPAFEVASIRPCEDNVTRGPQSQPGGRVTLTCVPPGGLLMDTFNLISADQAVGWPKWFGGSSTAHNVTIVAKAPAGASPDRDTLNAMMRKLLIDRYKLAFHYEDRPVDTYTLVVLKPKLTKADPSERTGCARQNEIHPGQGAVVHLDCRNMTVAQLAEQIPAYKIDIYYPIQDGTGIEGAWDFTIDYDTFSSFPRRGRGTAPATDGAVGVAEDPSGSVSFADAIQKQLGLKLEVHKRPEPVLVIDHMEEYPTEN